MAAPLHTSVPGWEQLLPSFHELQFWLGLLGPELLPPSHSHSPELPPLMGSSNRLLCTGLQPLCLDFQTNITTIRTVPMRYLHGTDLTKGSVAGFCVFFCSSNTNYLNQMRLPCFCSDLLQLIPVPPSLSYLPVMLLSPAPPPCPPAQQLQNNSFHNSAPYSSCLKLSYRSVLPFKPQTLINVFC